MTILGTKFTAIIAGFILISSITVNSSQFPNALTEAIDVTITTPTEGQVFTVGDVVQVTGAVNPTSANVAAVIMNVDGTETILGDSELDPNLPSNTQVSFSATVSSLGSGSHHICIVGQGTGEISQTPVSNFSCVTISFQDAPIPCFCKDFTVEPKQTVPAKKGDPIEPVVTIRATNPAGNRNQANIVITVTWTIHVDCGGNNPPPNCTAILAPDFANGVWTADGKPSTILPNAAATPNTHRAALDGGGTITCTTPNVPPCKSGDFERQTVYRVSITKNNGGDITHSVDGTVTLSMGRDLFDTCAKAGKWDMKLAVHIPWNKSSQPPPGSFGDGTIDRQNSDYDNDARKADKFPFDPTK